MKYKKIMAAASCSGDAERMSALSVYLEQNQADGLLINELPDLAESDLLTVVKAAADASDLPISVTRRCRRFEDAKKVIYAGAAQIVIPYEAVAEAAILETAGRFNGQVAISLDSAGIPDGATWVRLKDAGVSEVYMTAEVFEQCRVELIAQKMTAVITISLDEQNQTMPVSLMQDHIISGIADEGAIADGCLDISKLKADLKVQGIAVNVFESSIEFKDFKLNSDGLIPVVVQEYKSGKVLMLAYMNEESYAETLRSGRMTYFSRSRQELWKKGETSGHYQYVKSIEIDCDRDTMLAKVAQVGAACHTGNESCFYTNLVKKEYDDVNPLTIFDEIMGTILERKMHPKEGSYTNYLFEKGVDKILKKVGEEATEIVIAAKNPDDGELKYEICDFIYHMMVLMAERGVTWKEITKELAARH